MIWNSEQNWGWISRVLHWGMAVLIVFMLGLGAYAANFVDDIRDQFELTQLHKSWGFVVFCLALLRVAWRLINRQAPTPPAAARAIERAAARWAHLALYLFMIAMPLSGWLMASASPLQDRFGVKNKVFGWFTLYDPFRPGSEQLTEILGQFHFWCAVALTVVLLAHLGAALMHHFVKRDDVLRRMTFGRS